MISLPVIANYDYSKVVGRLMLSDEYIELMKKEVVVVGGIFDPNKGGLIGYTLSPIAYRKKPDGT